VGNKITPLSYTHPACGVSCKQHNLLIAIHSPVKQLAFLRDKQHS